MNHKIYFQKLKLLKNLIFYECTSYLIRLHEVKKYATFKLVWLKFNLKIEWEC